MSKKISWSNCSGLAYLYSDMAVGAALGLFQTPLMVFIAAVRMETVLGSIFLLLCLVGLIVLPLLAAWIVHQAIDVETNRRGIKNWWTLFVPVIKVSVDQMGDAFFYLERVYGGDWAAKANSTVRYKRNQKYSMLFWVRDPEHRRGLRRILRRN